MIDLHKISKFRIGLTPLLMVTLLAGCGGEDPILSSTQAGISPTVLSTSPLASTPVVTGVVTNTRVSVAFSKPMAPATLTPTSFTVACPASTPVAATVAYDVATQVATLTPTQALPAVTLCVATLTTAVEDTTGVPLASNYAWSFTTSAIADATRPSVTLTVPADDAGNVPVNRQLAATFSEGMATTTISGTSFTVRNDTLGAAVTGTVSYSAATRTATFTPSAPGNWAANNVFTATVSTVATDLAGNTLAGNHAWTFTTSAATDTTAPTVATINPLDAATGMCTTKIVSAVFSEPMDVGTINTTTFRVTDNGVAVTGQVSYDTTSQTATFAPNSSTGFASNRSFVVTVASGSSGVKDLAGNALVSDRTWTFTTNAQACSIGVNLRTIASFGAFGGGAGVTNQGINTVIQGDLATTAACSLITGLHDAANTFDETNLNVGAVNGSVYCAPPAPGTDTTMSIATQASADAQTAYDDLAALPPGSDPAAGQLGGLILPPAVYTSAGGTFDITTGDLTLDAQGDANAVWVFQSASALTVGLNATPRRVLLINGAQAKNVFWQVGSAARIEDGSTMVGTIIAPAGVTISTADQTIQTTLVGRAIGLTASVTMVNTTVVAP